MKLEGYREAFYTFSGKASDFNRQLAFAAIAVIWLFKKDVGGAPTIPTELILPGIFVVLSLILDLLHYCVASIIWRLFYRSKERANVQEDVELQHDDRLEKPIWVLFVLKIACVIVAYLYILKFLIKTLLNQPI